MTDTGSVGNAENTTRAKTILDGRAHLERCELNELQLK